MHRNREETINTRPDKLTFYIQAAAVTVIVISTFTLLGWSANMDILRQIIPKSRPMSSPTAILLILSAAGVLLLFNSARRRTVYVLSAIVGLLAISYESANIFGVSIVHDRIPFAEIFGRNSMSPNVAFYFLIGAAGLGLIDVKTKWGYFAPVMFTVLTLAAFLGLLGHFYGEERFYQVGDEAPMAVGTALSFFLLGTAGLAARPDRGFVAELLSDYEGGKIARVLFPLTLIVPLAVGVLDHYFDRSGLFAFRYNIALIAGGTSALAAAMLIYTARSANRSAAERSRYFSLCADLLCEADFDGKFRRLNPAWEKTLGYSLNDMEGKPFLSFVHPDDREMTSAETEKLSNLDTTLNFENRYLRADGEYRWLRWNAVASSSPPRIYAAARDVTEEKLYLNKIEALHEELEEKNQRLGEVNKELESFSYSVSHDLRAPLRAINGFAEILVEDFDSELNDEMREVIEVISSNSKRIGQLIDDLLRFSQTGRTVPSKTKVDMTALVHRIVEKEKRNAPDHSAQVDIGDLPEAYGDPSLLHQVIQNLVSNAFKYSRHNPDARIEIHGEDAGNEKLYYIKDNGAGFDMRYVDKLFGVFQRLHREEEFEGTGVGLALVKQIIERHGGRVWAEGESGEGARFDFTLPANVIEKEKAA